MRKLLLVSVMTAASLLVGCDSKGIYGDYKNEQFGLVLKISEKNIEFKGRDYVVNSWNNDENAGTYVAHTVINTGSSEMKWNLRFKKEKSDVIYDGVLFKRD
ncbi:hypothetical protein [Pantoea agglomerans]|uniref:hypothetical protein n=1 Tax=Enterobacter agglomerans TaxID=549 RepID=UPI003C7A093F